MVMERKAICYLLILAASPLLVNGQMLKLFEETSEIIRDSPTVTEDWEQLEKILKNFVNTGLKSLMPLLMDDMQSVNISTTCLKDTMKVIGGLRNLKTWAMRFVDSAGQGLDGMITGSYVNFGAYDECIDTVVLNERYGKQKGQVMFTGKYCLLNVRPHLPARRAYKENEIMVELKNVYEKGTVLSEVAKHAHMLYFLSIRFGLCVPSGCSLDDVNNVLAKVSDYLRIHMKVRRCEVKEEPTYTPLMIAVMSIYSFVGFIVLLGTLIDGYYNYSEKKPRIIAIRILLAFSFTSNFQKLVDTSTSSKSLSCLNGIRCLTITWVIMVHSYLLLMFQGFSGMFYARHLAQHDIASQVLANSTLSVDTFFFLGGFLVCYVATNHVKVAKRNFSIKLYIIHRLWRILPVYIFAVLFIFIIKLVASGPVAHGVLNPFVVGCKENWWGSLLFINNFYHAEDACLPHTWYLSVDMQLYIGSLIILLPLFRWPKVGISIAVVILVCSMIASAVVTHVYNFPPTFLTSTQNFRLIADFMTQFYFKPYPHTGPYMIGILAGYFLALHPEFKISKVNQLLGWCCAIICTTSALYGAFGWNEGREPTFWESVLYSGCHRVAWAVGIAWMVICCATGHGGVVNYILSWKVWIPLGRLTYTAYVAHFVVQLSFMAMIRTPFYPKHVMAVWLYFGHLISTYGVAFAATMLIESPFISLEKIFLPQRTTRKPRKMGTATNQALDVVTGSMNIDKSQSEKGTDNGGFVCRL